jgi:hypothetical protein
MRLAIYGTVLLLALGVLAVRSAKPQANGSWAALYHGQTPEGLLSALSVRDGKVRQAYLRWRMTCEGDHRPYTSSITFKRELGDRFEYDGRRFSTGGRQIQKAGRGETIRFDVRVSGRLAEDGLSASGSGQTTETWMRDGRTVATCRSARVPWTVHRGTKVAG